MKRLMIMFAAVAILAPACLWAQDPPKAEVFGGFSVLHTTAGDNDEGFTPVGWAASLAGNINPKMGVVADFAGNYKDGVKMHSYMGGLRYNHRMAKALIVPGASLAGRGRFVVGAPFSIRWQSSVKGYVPVPLIPFPSFFCRPVK